MPFWQSKIKQKSAVANADSRTKLEQLVPGPANKSPPPSVMAAAMLKRCLRERIVVSFVAGENSRHLTQFIGARPSTRTPYTGKYRSFTSPRQAGGHQFDHRARHDPLAGDTQAAHTIDSCPERLSGQVRSDAVRRAYHGEPPAKTPMMRSLFTGSMIPRSVIIPRISVAGVTSNAGQ